MGLGVFGKLPQKRDFVSFGIPDTVLHPFEAWLQSAVAASRAELGREWEDQYLVAPIWRFWIGREILGRTCAGALMPSVDKVGRFFPLVLMESGGEGGGAAPPPFHPREDWYKSMEARLLSVLADDAEAEVDQLASDIASTEADPQPPEPAGEEFRNGAIWRGEPGSPVAELVGAVVEADYWRAAAGRSFWWTAGGAAGAPALYVRAGLPDPYFFSRMIRSADG